METAVEAEPQVQPAAADIAVAEALPVVATAPEVAAEPAEKPDGTLPSPLTTPF